MSRIRSAATRVALALATFGAGGAGLALAAQPAYASVLDNGGCTAPSNSPQIYNGLACEITSPSSLVSDVNASRPYPMTINQPVTVGFTLTNITNEPISTSWPTGGGSNGTFAEQVQLQDTTLQPGASESGTFVLDYYQSFGYSNMSAGVSVGVAGRGIPQEWNTVITINTTQAPPPPPPTGPAPTNPPCSSVTTDPVVGLANDGSAGYWIATSTGRVIGCGSTVPWYGSPASQTQGHVPSPVVGIAASGAAGYYVVTAKGNVFNYGGAPWYGSLASAQLPSPVVGMAVTPTGYVLTTAAGNVYNFHTPWYGSAAGAHLSSVVGIEVAGNGGYRLVTSSGGVLNYNAPWYGSPLAAKDMGTSPVVGIAQAGSGYVVTTADNHSYPFGTTMGAAYSYAADRIVAVAVDQAGGYWTLGNTGAVYSYASAPYRGGVN